jgi:dimethylaniline monooxygenase (N-oxide forming)
MSRRVAVIGAGPSGLVAAKSLIEAGLEPVVFEASRDVGGLWQCPAGHVWPDMHTNLSKWTCAFSDYPWAADSEEFPLSPALHGYLKDYASHFDIRQHVRFGERVQSLALDGAAWTVMTSATPAAQGPFAGVIVCAGAFARASFPRSLDLTHFRGRVIHSAQYKSPAEFEGKKVAVVGGSLSGLEISAHLAAHGAQVSIIFSHPVWILPRYMTLPNLTAPWDLVLYRRAVQAAGDDEMPNEETYRRIATYYEMTFGNPGAVHEDLRTKVDGSPPYVVVSDRFLEFVASGAITPVRGRVAAVTDDRILTDGGRSIAADAVVLCTGYDMDLSFLPEFARLALAYDATDKFLPFVAYRTVMHPQVPNLYLVGLYRGPYFGVIELQARWAAALLAGTVSMPPPDSVRQGIERENQLRSRRPLPQYPHSEYVEFADSIACELKVHPSSCVRMHKAITNGPVIPAHYRLVGPHARPEIARAAIESACMRIGMKL